DIGNQKTKDNNKITDDRQQTTNNNLQTDKEIKKEKETDNQKSRIDNPKKPFPFWLFTGNGDTTAPIITITSSPPAISSSTIANFQFSSDEKNVIFLLRQGYRGQVGEGDDSWQECSANIEINNLNNNQHSLEIKAIDQSGNKSVAITHSWLVDTIAPTSTINNLEQEYATSSFSVSWTGEDVIASSTASSTEISGLANYDLEYKIATGTEEWINWISATTSTSAAFNITVENNQNIYFKIRARDNAGNVGEWSNEAETKIDDNIASHVVISEFAVQGLSDSYDEFVELYNPTNFEVDITGWKLQYKSADGTNWSNKTGNNGLPSLFIKPRGFLLLAGKDYSLNASPDYWHNANWGLANNAGHIRIVDIVDKEDIEIDKIGYGNAIDPEDLPFMENIISGKSAERKANKNSTSETIASSTDKWTGNGFDSNNNSVDFIVRNTSDPQNSDSPTEPRSESPIFPETIQDLTVLHLFTSTSSMKLSWSSSNNSNINTGAFYDIRYNESVEDECELINNWHLANKVEESLPVPLEEEGIEQEVLINNLSPGKEYCFGIRVFNGSFWSFPSNIVNATTKTSQTQLTKIITVGNPKNIIITQTLTPDKSPYYIDYSLYLLPVRASTGVLTIKPGVVIKFGSGRQGQWSWERVILFVNGLIKANGTEKNPIVFTSIYDDDYGGDSNGDGPTPVPDSAIWNSFQINSGGNVFNHNIFRYGGFDNRGIITFYNASTLYHENNLISNSIFDNNINGVGFRAYASDKQDIIQNNIFRNFQNSAISFLATDKSNPIITHNNFLNNKTAFLVERSHLGAPIINYNNIYGNNYGVKNINIDSCFAINAKHNWWGSETGPNNILNPDGQGDQIYGDVDYSEWVITEL
ncbi:MAG: lamin tail domain-containing protein, partial [Patescibacteria group bacterium]